MSTYLVSANCQWRRGLDRPGINQPTLFGRASEWGCWGVLSFCLLFASMFPQCWHWKIAESGGVHYNDRLELKFISRVLRLWSLLLSIIKGYFSELIFYYKF